MIQYYNIIIQYYLIFERRGAMATQPGAASGGSADQVAGAETGRAARILPSELLAVRRLA